MTTTRTLAAPANAPTLTAPLHPLRDFWRYFSASRGAMGGLLVVVVVFLLAAFAGVVAPYNPDLTDNTVFLVPPAWQTGGSSAHWLGTDAIGRDILSRLIHGARLSLTMGVAVVALSVLVGTVIGLLAGYFRGVFEIAVMRVMDIILTLPSLLLAIVIVAILGPGLMNAMLAVAIVVLPHYVRITRAAVISESSRDYVTAARMGGAGHLRIMFSEILPNCTAPLIVQASLGISTAIIDAAALGFLGLGAQPPSPEWGTMLADAREFVLRAWWVVTFPGLAILITVLAFNLLGDGLRDALDPKLKRSNEAQPMALLEIENLSVEFPSHQGVMVAVDGVSLALDTGDVLGIVGESGSGKSVTMMALMGLVAYPGRVKADTLRFDGHDLLALSDRERRRLTGKDLSMIFQDPTTSLNPCFTVGFQLAETLKLHLHLDKVAARKRCIELLEQVGIPAAESRLGVYPHQLSGGMSQRVMIAMAIACNPKLLIADEPTTALDVTIQAQILDLLRSLQKERGMALVLITHNMGVVSEMAQQVAVMYAGQVMELRGSETLFNAPQHPYTEALMAALPERNAGHSRLATIPGMVPGLYDRPAGCLFAPRCSYANDGLCQTRAPLRDWKDGCVRCHFPIGDPNRSALAPRHAELTP